MNTNILNPNIFFLRIRHLAFVAMLCLALVACDSTEPDVDGPGEEELITRVVVTLTGGGETVTAVASDNSGIGSGELNVQTLELTNGVTYEGTIELFNDADDVNITTEIDEERDEHQFFYTVEGVIAPSVDFRITDVDGNNLPLGLSFRVFVAPGTTGSGGVRIQLAHYGDSPKDGTSLSDETDVDFVMPITVN